MQNKNVARDVGDADAFSQVGSMFNLDELRIISSMKSIVDDASEPIWLRIREQFAEWLARLTDKGTPGPGPDERNIHILRGRAFVGSAYAIEGLLFEEGVSNAETLRIGSMAFAKIAPDIQREIVRTTIRMSLNIMTDALGSSQKVEAVRRGVASILGGRDLPAVRASEQNGEA